MDINQVNKPKFNVGDMVHFCGLRSFDGEIVDRKWNSKAYLGFDGVGGWQYLIKSDYIANFWRNERVLLLIFSVEQAP